MEHIVKVCSKDRGHHTGHEGNDNYCWQCGGKLVVVSKCSCGKQLGPVDHFCPNCGKETEYHEQSKTVDTANS